MKSAVTTVERRLSSQRVLEIGLFLVFVVALGFFAFLGYGALPRRPRVPFGAGVVFDGQRAFQAVLTQHQFGVRRDTGSEGWRRTGVFISQTLRQYRWKVEFQEFIYQGTKVRNIIGRAGQGPVVIIGAHYDTRRHADNDPNPDNRAQPVPGANDGASGVAVLLELARSLDPKLLKNEVWLVFFDAEDNGQIDGWDWTVGSRYMADNLTVTPQYVIVVDMVGDSDQQIFYERNSDANLSQRIWNLAAQLGFWETFIPQQRHSLLDDHIPFAQKGIPAIDIIDFDYPYWHTVQDTPDKVSPTSLQRVGRVLETFLEQGSQ